MLLTAKYFKQPFSLLRATIQNYNRVKMFSQLFRYFNFQSADQVRLVGVILEFIVRLQIEYHVQGLAVVRNLFV
jgi:hypothetical protein